MSYVFIPALCLLVYWYYLGLFDVWTSLFLGQSEFFDLVRHVISPLVVLSLLYLYFATIGAFYLLRKEDLSASVISYIVVSSVVMMSFYVTLVDHYSWDHGFFGAVWFASSLFIWIRRSKKKQVILVCLLSCYLFSCFFSYQIGVRKRDKILSSKDCIVLSRDNNGGIWRALDIKERELIYFIHLGTKNFFITKRNTVQQIDDSLLCNAVFVKGRED